MSGSILTGDLTRRLKKYNTEERQDGKYRSYQNTKIKNTIVKFVTKL